MVGAGQAHGTNTGARAEQTTGGTRTEMMVGRASVESPAESLGRMPKPEWREGGATVESWQTETCERSSDTKPMVMETQAEPKSPGITDGPGDQGRVVETSG